MPTIRANGIDICYDEFGSPDDPALLLVMGFTAQMIAWDEGFCEQLASHGFHVIRYDNRDVGLSSKTEGSPPSLKPVAGGLPEITGGPTYSLSDMAADGLALLTELGIDKAHIVGASMGGMIVQRMAIEHPDRVLSMTSIMSTTGNPSVGQASPDALGALLELPPTEREAYLDHSVKVGRVISGPLFDPAKSRERSAKAFDRSYHPVGAGFQMAAILSDTDRTEALGALSCPVLVIHGRADMLITVSGGEATAKAIPGAELLVLDDMGHDLPEPLWPEVTASIAKLAARV